MTYEEVYEQICVGCIDEKKCHDECILCGRFYDLWGEDDDR